MKGLVKFQKGENGIEIRDINEPVLNEGEVKIKVLAAGICGSDIHALKDEGNRKVAMPVVLGHEFVGLVVETCGETEDINLGDWVTALPACYSCGTCSFCKEGLVTLCKDRKSIGTHVNGAMANFVKVPAKYCFKLPYNLKTSEERKLYALAEPMCCAVRSVYENIDVKAGDTVVVTGPGTMGLLATQLFKIKGATVILFGRPTHSEKLILGKNLGADFIATSVYEINEIFKSLKITGADITCDTTGSADVVNSCFELVRARGTHLQIGIFGKPITLNIDRLFDKEVTYHSSNSTAVSSWKIGMDLLESHKIYLKPLITKECPLDDWKKGFSAIINKEAIKVILLPDNNFD